MDAPSTLPETIDRDQVTLVHALCRRVLGCRWRAGYRDVDDVAQEVLRRIAAKPSLANSPGALRQYIRFVEREFIRSASRERARVQSINRPAACSDSATDVLDLGPVLDEFLRSSPDGDAARFAIECLISGRPPTSLAGGRGIHPRTARRTFVRGVDALRAFLGPLVDMDEPQVKREKRRCAMPSRSSTLQLIDTAMQRFRAERGEDAYEWLYSVLSKPSRLVLDLIANARENEAQLRLRDVKRELAKERGYLPVRGKLPPEVERLVRRDFLDAVAELFDLLVGSSPV